MDQPENEESIDLLFSTVENTLVEDGSYEMSITARRLL